MLLVGSFEPFDEAEARRVGADDILTKPFQSIRRLIDKVGSLVTNRPADERPTAELRKLKKSLLKKKGSVLRNWNCRPLIHGSCQTFKQLQRKWSTGFRNRISNG